MKLAFIRGQYLNNFELQNYYPILEDPNIEMTGFTSQKPMHTVKLPLEKFPSPVDLPNFPYKLQILNRLFKDAMYLWGLESKLSGYDIAHVRETYFHFSSQAIKAKQQGKVKKVLVTCSETIPFNHETIWGRKALKQNVLQHADHFHCLTEKAKKALNKEGVSAKKITVIPYGIDLTQFKPKQATSRMHKHVRLLFVGRLEEQKGIYELMNAYRQLKQDMPKVQLTVIGKGPLEWLVKEQGIQPQTHPYTEMPKIFQQADMLILPSKPDRFWEEYFGMVLLEAMASKLPIVTTKTGGIPEVVADTAMVVAPANSNALYDGIRFMIEKDTWRTKLVKRAYKRVITQFDCLKQAAKLKNLYYNLC